MRRIERVQELIYREIAKLALGSMKQEGVVLSFTRVEVAPNLRSARVFFVTYPSHMLEEMLTRLKKAAPFLQKELNTRLRMRPVPRIIFAIDETEMQAAKVEDILRKLEIKDES